MVVENILDKVFEERKKNKRNLYSFYDYCYLIKNDPESYIQNIFQIISSMIKNYTKKETRTLGAGEYIHYNIDDIFVEGHDEPFFADQFFACNFYETLKNLNRKDNRIYLFEGPHGSGKSIFLNNLIEKICLYANSCEICLHEIVWQIPDKDGKNVQIPCPNHDHPILLIPKSRRKQFLINITNDKDFLEKLNEKEYEWVFTKELCAVCEMMFQALIDCHDNFEEVFEHIFTRERLFDRRMGEGVAIYNMNDKLPTQAEIYNEKTQEIIDNYYKSNNKARFVYSELAKTNDGVYSLMDVKGNNVKRYEQLHSVSSEGIQRVENFEEQIKSFFIAVTNPHDEDDDDDDDDSNENKLMEDSFEDRKLRNQINYILDDETELQIYYTTFGKKIEELFMSEVLRAFAKVIVATRMKSKSKAIENEWLGANEKYHKYCDSGYLLLKMNLYKGVIPNWITEDDLNKFNNRIRKAIMREGVLEGDDGASGRYSIQLLQELLNQRKENQYLTIVDVWKFFHENEHEYILENIPENFLDDVQAYYNYTVLNQIKDCLYEYSYDNIQKAILDYLYIILYDVTDLNTINVFTNQKNLLNKEDLKKVESGIFGYEPSDEEKEIFREDQIREYATNTSMEEKENVRDTRQVKHLINKYQHNLKETALQSLKENDTFRQAIKDYNTEEFRKYDGQIKENVQKLFQRLIDNYGYNEKTAQDVTIYVIDKRLADVF